MPRCLQALSSFFHQVKGEDTEFVLLIRLNWSFAIILELKDIVYLKA